MDFDLRGYVDITEADQRQLARLAYAASRPQGMGMLHYREGELDEETLTQIMEVADKYHEGAIDLDYVHGRACKLRVRRYDGKRYVRLDWYDHSAEAMKVVLRQLNLPDVEARIAEAERTGEQQRREWDEERRRMQESSR
jgi:hypothetical protein